ncbi:MAG: polysaccharide deacetylase, partial [Candidatus Dadabacteria bacterium]
MPQPSPSFPSAFTVDVEDYFHVSAFEAVCPPETWEAREIRVERNTERVLELLGAFGVRATFFVLGWVAERCPGLVRRIAAAGHEIACHGYGHRRVTTLTREAFRDDVRRAKGLLEDLAGVAVRGYRAPSYSIGPTTLWAFDELVEAGFTYDSSVFPVRHDLYGLAEWPRFPFWLERLEGEGAGNWVPSDPGAEPGGPRFLEVPVT